MLYGNCIRMGNVISKDHMLASWCEWTPLKAVHSSKGLELVFEFNSHLPNDCFWQSSKCSAGTHPI